MMMIRFEGHDSQLWLLVALFFLSLLIYSWRKNRNVNSLFFRCIFLVYLFFLLDITFFPISVNSSYTSLEEGFRFGINWIPFNWDFSFLPHIVFWQIIQNILLTVPFGFGISFVLQLKPQFLLWIVPAVGISIELVQFLISLTIGYTYRIIDINDVILNALGVLIGYSLFRVFGIFILWLTHQFEQHPITQAGIMVYVRQVVTQHTQTASQS